ncbi:Copper resistance protein B [Aurantiacibacter gangjinensis]|nr:Copper resistance protein B [Aurantiacibacter gangjinensis]
MRMFLLASAAMLIAVPAATQDHAQHDHHSQQQPERDEHAGHEMPDADDPESADETHDGRADHSAMDHSTMDHSAMGHGEAGHEASDHGQMDHHQMDHSQHGEMDHAAMGHAMPAEIPSGPPPPRAFEGPEHAADLFFDPARMAQARAYNHATHGNMATGTLLFERLETRFADGEEEYVWDVTGWYGTSTDKIVFKSEGEGEFGGGVEEAEMQLLYGRAIGPFVDLQVGARVDAEPDTRAHAVIGVAGLAPYMVHFDAALFVADTGDVTARIEAEHDIKFTQSLILQPRVEAELSAQDIPERAIGTGLYELSVGARLRYGFVPEFAPYIGIEWEGATGRTADILRASGDDTGGVAVLAGLRFWF